MLHLQVISAIQTFKPAKGIVTKGESGGQQGHQPRVTRRGLPHLSRRVTRRGLPHLSRRNEERPATFEQKSNEERPATFQQRLGDESKGEGKERRMVHILLLQTGHYVFRNKSRRSAVHSVNKHSLGRNDPQASSRTAPPRAHTLLYQLIQRLLQNRGPHGAHVIAVVQHGVGMTVLESRLRCRKRRIIAAWTSRPSLDSENMSMKPKQKSSFLMFLGTYQ